MTAERPSLDASEYFASPGLSNSGMSDLAVSPLRYWHRHINPNRPADEPTPEQRFGTALHCAVLEPAEFEQRYACQIEPEDFDGCLVTIEDMRGWLRDRGYSPKGTRKAEIAAQVQAVDPDAPIFDIKLSEFEQQHAGKIHFKKDDWFRLGGAAQSLRDEPRIQAILQEGTAEVSRFVTDPETGVPLKARMDWRAPSVILDLKTFTQKRGKSIDKCVADAIFYEQYYRQACLYSTIEELCHSKRPDFVLAFVESEEPFETRIKLLQPKRGGQPNLYWTRALLEIKGLIRTYAECVKEFGDKPWRYAQEISVLCDEEMPGLAY